MVGYSSFTPAAAHTILALPMDFSLGNSGGLLDFFGYMGNIRWPFEVQRVTHQRLIPTLLRLQSKVIDPGKARMSILMEVVEQMVNFHVDIMANPLVDLRKDILVNPLKDLQMNILENLLSTLWANILTEFQLNAPANPKVDLLWAHTLVEAYFTVVPLQWAYGRDILGDLRY